MASPYITQDQWLRMLTDSGSIDQSSPDTESKEVKMPLELDLSPDEILSVSHLNEHAKTLLEQGLGMLWVMGEISNLSRPSSGHWYFTLKDEQAQIRCAMFRQSNRRVNFDCEEGQQVLVFAKVSLYAPRGDYQLIVEDLQAMGAGALQIAFEKLKKQLEKEGLFSETHKKSLPKFPQKIGVITSATGAALQDILKVLSQRAPYIPVMIYPCQVQGTTAGTQIVAALEIANQRKECDVLIVARGGGSLEDLWCFNEPAVAYAIFNSHIPIITGIGHEIDLTIADFVADCRAPTPSAAAEKVAPDAKDLLQHLSHCYSRLQQKITAQLTYYQVIVEKFSRALKHPRDRLQEYTQRLDQLETRLLLAQNHLLAMKNNQLTVLSRALQAISPLAVLDRGYAVIKKDNGDLMTRAKAASIDDELIIQWQDGSVLCRVIEVLYSGL